MDLPLNFTSHFSSPEAKSVPSRAMFCKNYLRGSKSCCGAYLVGGEAYHPSLEGNLLINTSTLIDSNSTLPRTNSSHLKTDLPKRKGLYSNHPFSGAFAVSFTGCLLLVIPSV